MPKKARQYQSFGSKKLDRIRFQKRGYMIVYHSGSPFNNKSIGMKIQFDISIELFFFFLLHEMLNNYKEKINEFRGI